MFHVEHALVQGGTVTRTCRRPTGRNTMTLSKLAWVRSKSVLIMRLHVMADPANGPVMILRPRASSPTSWPNRGASTNRLQRLNGRNVLRSCLMNAGRSTLACSSPKIISVNLSSRSCSKAFLSARRTLRPSAARPSAVLSLNTASLRSGGSDLLSHLIVVMRRKLRKDHSSKQCRQLPSRFCEEERLGALQECQWHRSFTTF
jgi:hypothetical protein